MATTPEQRAELKALADAATPGPWWSGVCNPADGHALAWIGSAFVECNGGRINYAAPSRDAEFIAAAREAIPALLADLEELRNKWEATTREGLGLVSDLSLAREELAATRKQLAESRMVAMHSGDFKGLVDYVLQDDLHNRLTPRVVDIAYTAFTLAKQPNAEDGGASDWFNDTKPSVIEAVEKLRKDLSEAASKDTDALDAAVAAAVEPYKQDAELGRTAMRFVDRAGDVHPGVDDAETICREFYEAMSEAIDAARKGGAA